MIGSTATGALQALGWALVHSLWQAGLVTAAVKLILRAIPLRAARARYAMALAGLATTAFLFAVTASWLEAEWWMHRSCWAEQASAATLSASFCRSHGRELPGAAPASAEAPPLSERFIGVARRGAGLLENATPSAVLTLSRSATGALTAIVLAWAVAVVLLLASGAFSLVRLSRLRKRAAPVQGEGARALEWARHRLRVDRAVELRTGVEIAMPGAMGFRRPTILIPSDVIEILTVDELRGLLTHELAHASSLDYPLSLGQALLERLVFFNPFLRGLGRIVTEEREALRDRAAEEAGIGARTYVEMLLTIDGLRGIRRHRFLGFQSASDEGTLLRRVHRLLRADESVRHRRFRALLVAAAIFAWLAAFQGTLTAAALSAWAVMAEDSSSHGPGTQPGSSP